MKQAKKLVSLFLALVCMLGLASISVSADTYYLSDSDRSSIKNADGTSYSCDLKMKSTVTGGATSLVGNYSVSSKGTLKGEYPGYNPAYCEKIRFENTYKFSVIGGISLSVGTNGASVSGISSSSSRTISDTYSKSDYPNLYKLNESISCKAQCWCIYWHYQNASVTYTIKVNGNPRSASVSTADNTVIW